MDTFVNVLIGTTVLLAGVLIGAMIQSSINYSDCLDYHESIVYTEAKNICNDMLKQCLYYIETYWHEQSLYCPQSDIPVCFNMLFLCNTSG